LKVPHVLEKIKNDEDEKEEYQYFLTSLSKNILKYSKNFNGVTGVNSLVERLKPES